MVLNIACVISMPYLLGEKKHSPVSHVDRPCQKKFGIRFNRIIDIGVYFIYNICLYRFHYQLLYVNSLKLAFKNAVAKRNYCVHFRQTNLFTFSQSPIFKKGLINKPNKFPCDEFIEKLICN